MISGTACRRAERVERVLAFGERQLLGQRHPVEAVCRGSRSSAAVSRACSASSAISAIGRFRPADARELLADQPVLLLQAVEHVGDAPRPCPAPPAAAACGRSAPCRRRPGRSRPRPIFLRPVRDLRSRLRAGRSRASRRARRCPAPTVEQRVDVVAIEPGAVLEDVAERPSVLAQPSRERARRVELDGVQGTAAPAASRRGLRRQPDAERVAERMGGIGGHHQHAGAGGAPRRRPAPPRTSSCRRRPCRRRKT